MNAFCVAGLSILLAIDVLPTATCAAATPVPCEKMLGDVKAALQAAVLSDADKVKVADLASKGIERCKADDDAHADELFTQALALMGK
jgi:hypothetical protein